MGTRARPHPAQSLGGPAGLVGLVNPDTEVSRGHPRVVGMGPEDSEAQAGFPITRHLGLPYHQGQKGTKR